jgi:hypothetical protein
VLFALGTGPIRVRRQLIQVRRRLIGIADVDATCRDWPTACSSRPDRLRRVARDPRLLVGRIGYARATYLKGPRLMLLIVLIVLVLLLLFGGFGYSRRGRRG